MLKNAEKRIKFLGSRCSSGSKENWTVIPRAKNTGRKQNILGSSSGLNQARVSGPVEYVSFQMKKLNVFFN